MIQSSSYYLLVLFTIYMIYCASHPRSPHGLLSKWLGGWKNLILTQETLYLALNMLKVKNWDLQSIPSNSDKSVQLIFDKVGNVFLGKSVIEMVGWYLISLPIWYQVNTDYH